MDTYKEHSEIIKKIKIVFFDIDGVLTDGQIYIDQNGNEMKSVNIRDIDSVYAIQRKGILIAAITGEDTPIVEYFRNRFPWDYFRSGIKNKLDALKEIENKENLTGENICYIGDGKYDSESILYSGLGVCPCDASEEAKASAKIILKSKGGRGCVQELERILIGDTY